MAARAIAGKAVPGRTTPSGRVPAGRKSSAPPARMVRRDEAPAVQGAIPVLRMTTTGKAAEEVWEPLFYIDDEEYCVLANPPEGIGVRALDILADGKPFAEHRANRWLLIEMLGEEGYAALLTYPKLETEQYNHVLKVCSDLALGAMEAPKTR